MSSQMWETLIESSDNEEEEEEEEGMGTTG
jgi:hypothetical protein